MSLPSSASRRGRRAATAVAAKLFAALLAAAASAQTFAQTFAQISAPLAPLTLQRAQQLALAHSRVLPAQDAAAQASREMATAAGQLPDPVLKVGIDNLPVDGPDRYSTTADFMTMRRIGLMQELTRGDKRQWRAERYRREAEKSLAEKGAAAAAIRRDSALAWLERYYAQAAAALLAHQQERAKAEIQAAEAAYRGGRGSQAELLAARSALAALDDRMDEALRRLRGAGLQLARWTGSAADAPLAGAPEIDKLPLVPADLERQLSHHPELAAASQQEEIAAADVQLALADKKADWSVEVGFQQRGPTYSNMVSVGISLPLQWDQAKRQDRALAAKLALLEQAKAEREEMLRAHVAETRVLLDEWQSDRARLQRYRQELLPLAEQRSDAEVAAYRGGKAALADVLAARRSETEQRLQALQLEADTARLWARLNFMAPTSSADDALLEMSEDKQ